MIDLKDKAKHAEGRRTEARPSEEHHDDAKNFTLNDRQNDKLEQEQKNAEDMSHKYTFR